MGREKFSKGWLPQILLLLEYFAPNILEVIVNVLEYIKNWYCVRLALQFFVAYSELCQIYTMKLFAKTVNGYKPLTIFAESSILDVWQGSEYASDPSLLLLHITLAYFHTL